MKKVVAFLFAFLCMLLASKPSFASPPPNFQRNLIVGTGLNAPSGFGIAPDGRIFITERQGGVRVVKTGQLLPTPFTTLPSAATGDRGLVGVAFDPNFLTNHYVYFYYTDAVDLHNKLVRFDASMDTAMEGGLLLYQTSDQSFSLHIGGTVQFGPDGKLYISIGDNGNPPNAQDITNPHGKIIRLNRDGTIPTDNPFYTIPGAAKEIWAVGFRNPFRFQFDSVTGNMYEGDVGEASWEEINKVIKGGNYGWPDCEGYCKTPNSHFIDPIYAWFHNPNISAGSAAAVGGPVYHGDMFPADYQGRLFFGDYAQGWMKTMKLDSNGNNGGVEDFDTNVGTIVDIHTDPKDGSLYYVDIFPGALYQVTYSTGNHAPIANATADKVAGNAPLTVTFSSSGTTDPDNDPLTYFWDFGDGTHATEANPTKIYNNPGTYTVQMKVSDGQYTSLAVPIVIRVGIPPTVNIIQPLDKSTYHAGDTIHYSIDAEDGALNDLSGNQVATTIVFHHQSHIHPFLGPVYGTTGNFTIPTTGESSPETWYEMDVTATDGSGLSTTKAITIHPVESQLTFTANPIGLKILLDGIPTDTPYPTAAVIGFQRKLSVPVYQQKDGTYFTFHNWSDGGEVIHVITTPPLDATYSAQFDTASAFHAQYFKNTNLSGDPAITRDEKAINFPYGDTGSPDPSIGHNTFSARWTASQYFAKGKYMFSATVDDGVRLFIDGHLVIDKWIDEATTTYTATVDLTAGQHEIKMEYYQAFGGAVAQLTWDLSPDNAIVTPTPTPTPTTAPTPTVSPTTTPIPSITATPTPTPHVSPTPTPGSGSPTPTPSDTPTPPINPTPTTQPTPPVSGTPSPTETPSVTPTPSSEPTPTDTPTPSVTPTNDPTPSPTPTPTPTTKPTPTPMPSTGTPTPPSSPTNNNASSSSSNTETPAPTLSVSQPTPTFTDTQDSQDFLTENPSPTTEPTTTPIKSVKGTHSSQTFWQMLMQKFQTITHHSISLWNQTSRAISTVWNRFFHARAEKKTAFSKGVFVKKQSPPIFTYSIHFLKL